MGRLGAIAALGVALLLSTPAHAQGSSLIRGITVLQPLRQGATSAALGFEAVGDVARIRVTVSGTSAAGNFAQVNNLIVTRDQRGSLPFHALIPFVQGLPVDAVLTIEAMPLRADGTAGTPSTRVLSRRGSNGPRIRGEPRLSATTNELVITVELEGDVAFAEASVLGVGAAELRAVRGNLKDVAGGAFAASRQQRAYPRSTDGAVTWTIPFVRSPSIDGLIVADLAIEDAFGRRIQRSVVEFVGESADSVTTVDVLPSTALLSGGYGSRLQLSTRITYALAGSVHLAPSTPGLTYRSADPSVVAVTASGELIARQNGTTNVEVEYLGFRQSVPVVVDSTASLASVRIVPSTLSLPAIGSTGPLKLEGTLSSGVVVDLTPAASGTVWTSNVVGVASVTANGLVNGLTAGRGSVRATIGSLSATADIEVIDASPTIRLTAPGSVRAGATFAVQAACYDDVGVSRVEFTVNSVPVGVDTSAPFTATFAAPPTAGATLRVGAVVVDTSGKRVVAPEVSVPVVGGAGTSALTPIWETPGPGSVVPVGAPQVLRVLSGSWKADPFTLSALDFQAVRFTVDDATVAIVTVPRMETRTQPVSGKVVFVPLWETTWTPQPGLAGASAVLRAEAIDRSGLACPVDAVLVSLGVDAPPFLSMDSPQPGVPVTVTAGHPRVWRGLAGDDTISLGVSVELRVDGATVAQTRAFGGTYLSGSGAAPFELSWTPPPSSVGTTHVVEVVGTDVANHPTRSLYSATVVADQPPSVAITRPTAQQVLTAGQSLVLEAAALDDSGGQVSLTWLVDGAPIGQSSVAPFSTTWLIPTSLTGRAVTIRAEARDTGGLVGSTETQVAIAPDTMRPTVGLVAPRDGTRVANTQDIAVTVGASDDVGVVRVDFLLDGQIIGSDPAPSRVSGHTATVASHLVVTRAQLAGAASHRLGARAVDAAGNVGAAPEAQLLLVADAPPELAFLTPAPGSDLVIGSRAIVEISATDDVAVASVSLRVDGAPIATRSAGPFSFEVPVIGPARTAVFEVEARDSAGVTATVTRSVDVVADTRPPLVAIRRPLPGGRVFAGRTVDVEVVASDDVGVGQARLSVAGQPELRYF